MKLSYRNIAGIVFLIALSASATHAQQTFTQTVTAQNTSCNNHCTVIDAPALNNNPNALIFVTQATGNGTSPIGAYYMYQNKWSVYNLNNAVMPVGATFNVEYYASPDANHFVYIVPQRVHSTDDAYIDHAGLNGNPNAGVRIFPTNPTAGNALFNQNSVHAVYIASAAKWAIIDDAYAAVPTGVAYNVMFSGGGPVVTNPNADKTINTNPKPPVNSSGCNCVIPTSLPPNGSAGGDLNGSYPYPKVSGLQGKPLSNDPPAVGQVLKWNGSAWEPANESAASGGNTYNAGSGLAIQGSTIYANSTAPMWNANQLSGHPVKNTTPTIGQVLRWNGTAWEPATETVANAATTTSTSPIQTFFKKGTQTSPEIINTQFPMAELNHTILLTKRSRLIISATVLITAEVEFGVIATQGTQANFILVINGVQIEAVKASAGVGVSNTATICNFMIDKDPGTYTLEFIVANSQGSGSPKTQAVARYSSVMVIPQ